MAESSPKADNVCPKCGHTELRLFFINYKEKMLMCGSTQCDYPFGCDDFQIVQSDELDSDSDTDCDKCSDVENTGQASADCSTETTKNKDTNNTQDVINLRKYFQPNDPDLHLKLNLDKEMALERKLSETKELFGQLQAVVEPSINIKNSKWIKNLLTMQSTTDVKLLTEDEVCFLGMNTPADGKVIPKLKICVDKNGHLQDVTDLSHNSSKVSTES